MSTLAPPPRPAPQVRPARSAPPPMHTVVSPDRVVLHVQRTIGAERLRVGLDPGPALAHARSA